MTRIALTLSLALAVACGGKNPGTYETLAKDTGATSSEGDAAAAEALWEQRAEPAKLQEAIAAYEAIAEANPSDRETLARVARGWYFLADAYTEPGDLQLERYQKAIEWGKRCMAINEGFATRIEDGDKEKDAAESLTVDDVPCTYWTASALGKWAKASGIAKSIKHLPTVKAYVGRVEELQPDYFFHGPARYWGAFYSVVPSFAGRDLEKSAEYFEKTLAGSPGYLGSYVLRAENLAVAAQDVKQFDADIETVLAFDLSTVPELEPENRMEVEKAKRLKEQRNELFDKKALEAAGE
jgi:tetratricopeptide (TPR) repeat protein